MQMTARAPVLSGRPGSTPSESLLGSPIQLAPHPAQFWTPKGREKARILNGFGLLHKPRDAPRLGSRDRPALGDLDQVAVAELARLDMRVVLARARDRLAHHRVPHTAFHPHHHRLLHLVAGHPAYQLALVPGRRSLLSHFAAFSLIRVRTRAMSRRTFFNWLVLVSCWVASCMRSPNCARSRPSSSFCSSSPLLPRSSVGSMSTPACAARPWCGTAASPQRARRPPWRAPR